MASRTSTDANDRNSQKEQVGPQDDRSSEENTAELIRTVTTKTREGRDEDPFDVDNPNWTFERTLVAAVRRAQEDDGVAPISPHLALAWKNVEVYGRDAGIAIQKDATSLFTDLIRIPARVFRKRREKPILHGIDGLLQPGEMLLVLGRPGSGCSTLLRMLAGEHGDYSRWTGHIDYSGIPADVMQRDFRGAAVYNGEIDHHFPYLTVAQTLRFAASTKTPRRRVYGITRAEYIEKTTEILGAAFGLRHTFNTRVGNDFVRGVSGGERRRVSIVEMVGRASRIWGHVLTCPAPHPRLGYVLGQPDQRP